MKIQKLLHSCLLVEEDGKRILIDPGDYCFIEKLIIPEKLKPIDAILITHSHGDHCDASAIKIIDAARVIGDSLTHAALAKEGIVSEIAKAGDTLTIGAIKVRVISAPHNQRLTQPMPESIGFIVNETLLHPGDSFDFETNYPYKVLALPIAAPWMIRKEALDLGVKLKPERIIPIHDGMLKNFAAIATSNLAQKYFEPYGIKFHPLKPGEILEV